MRPVGYALRMRFQRVTALLLLVLAARPDAAAQTSAELGPPVRIDFRALDENGAPVLDLIAERITLKVNGKVRQLQSLALSRIGDRGTTGGSALPPPFATNALAHTSRVVNMLIDEESIESGRETPVRDAVRRLLDELSPGDLIGVRTPQGQVNLQPTDDREAVRAAVMRLAGQGTRAETDVDAACRTHKTLGALTEMLATMSRGPTTIVIFSSGLTGPSAAPALMGQASGTCTVRSSDFQDLGTRASAAHAEFYLFNVTEGRASPLPQQAAGFESLAGVIGAEYVRLTGSPDASVARLLRETSAYYTASFVPDPFERNGQRFRVELRGDSEHVKLRSRPAVAIAKPTNRAKSVSPQDMLRVSASFMDLPLRAVAYCSRNAGDDNVKIVALFETSQPDVTLKSASIGLFDERGTLRKQWTAEGSDLTHRPVMGAVVTAPGVYRMRVAAVDGSGRTGTADYELSAEVARADPLKLSALVLGVQQNGAFAPRMQFANEPIAIGLLEIYDAPKATTVTVDLDVARSQNADPLATAQTTVTQAGAADVRIAFGGFNIASLAPGDYLMRATVSLDGKPVGRVMRTLRKTTK